MIMKKALNSSGNRQAFTLAEVVAALTIGAMILVAVLSVYGRLESAADGVNRKLDSSQASSEILQSIAEDLDRIVDGSSAVKITVKNKVKEGYHSAQLTILRTYNDRKNKPHVFEEIIWQANYDYESDANGLVLYRSYRGLGVEDKLLDEQRKDWEKNYTFVPVCRGITFFKILIPRGGYSLDLWTRNSLPSGITVIISFAEPFETLDGTLNVPDEEKVKRTIAVGRTRNIKFVFVKKESGTEQTGQENNKEEQINEASKSEQP